MASTDGSKVVGVVIRDLTDGDLTALKWAHEHLKRPDKEGFNYKMSLIQIIQVAEQTPREVPLNEGKPFGWFKIELQIAAPPAGEATTNDATANDHGNPPVNNNAPTAASPPSVQNTNKASTPHQPKNSSMAK
ncbi:hypothetical protein ACP4OV_009076 [Aristida adscensionis]